MKTITKKITGWLVMAAALTAGMTACSSDDITTDAPTSATTDAPKTYTMTVNAYKSIDASTRALSLDDQTNTLNATWKAGDMVSVTKESNGETQETYGTLTATNVSADGLSCTLTGELDPVPNVNEELTLRYHNGGYISQKGTLDYIATNCDIAIASVKVASVENGQITTYDNANFESQQAIVKFSLKQPDDTQTNSTTPIAAEYFLVKVNYFVGSTETVDAYEVTPDAAMSDIYVAIKGNTNIANVTLTALSSSGKYTYDKTDVTFQNGKYYAISVKMKQAAGGIQDLSVLSGNYEAPDCTVLTGTLLGTHNVSIAAGATVILKDVTIDGENYNFGAAGITCKGSATIILAGTNTVKGATGGYSGIYFPQSGKLTIKGSGSLAASGNSGGAGIGARNYHACGKIRIEGGTITATGGQWAAGIGGANNASCGSITITSGVTHVTAMKGTGASNSIGAGYGGTCGTVTIEDPSKVTQN